LAPTGVNPQNQETSNDLVTTGIGSELSSVELESTNSGSTQIVTSVPTSDPVQSQDQNSVVNSPRSKLQTPLHWRLTRTKRALHLHL